MATRQEEHSEQYRQSTEKKSELIRHTLYSINMGQSYDIFPTPPNVAPYFLEKCKLRWLISVKKTAI
jgi:hypothetical protein